MNHGLLIWIVKDPMDSQPTGKMARLQLGLAKARWQDANFLALIFRLSALDRWEKHCTISR